MRSNHKRIPQHSQNFNVLKRTFLWLLAGHECVYILCVDNIARYRLYVYICCHYLQIPFQRWQ